MMRPNWDESARTSLIGLKSTDLLHHTTSDQSMNMVEETPARAAPMPALNASASPALPSEANASVESSSKYM